MQATCFAPLYKVVRQPVWRLRRTSLGQPSVGSSQAARPSAGRLFQDLRPLPGFSPHSKPMWRHARRAGLGGAAYGLSQASDSLIEENYVPKGALLSTKLPSDVRKRAQDAIAKRGYSVTVREGKAERWPAGLLPGFWAESLVMARTDATFWQVLTALHPHTQEL